MSREWTDEEREAWLEQADTKKTCGAIKVGKDRFYWATFRYIVYLRSWDEAMQPDPRWLIGEGFEPTLEAATAAARKAGDEASGEWEMMRVPQPRGRRWRHQAEEWIEVPPNHRGHQGTIRNFYRKYHAKKPTPSEETDAGVVGTLGYVWERHHHRSVYDLHAAIIRRDGWFGHPITKRTPKRIWIAADKYGGAYGAAVLKSFDRQRLEADGYESWGWFTEAGMERHIEEQRRRDQYWRDQSNAYRRAKGLPPLAEGEEPSVMFPMLGISPPATRKQVMAAFRRRSKELHPDAGGDAEHFRSLVAEKDRALAMAA